MEILVEETFESVLQKKILQKNILGSYDPEVGSLSWLLMLEGVGLWLCL